MLLIGATGCSSGRSEKPLPASTEQLSLSAEITDACAKLGGQVKHPAMRAGLDDLEIVVLRYAAALEEANTTIGAKDDCVRDLVARYRAAGVQK